jgi:hypothetical protein
VFCKAKNLFVKTGTLVEGIGNGTICHRSNANLLSRMLINKSITPHRNHHQSQYEVESNSSYERNLGEEMSRIFGKYLRPFNIQYVQNAMIKA